MKAPKLLIAGMLALSSAGAVEAQTVIHITGSTAFRSAVHTAITHMMTNYTYAYTGTSFTGAGQAIFHGSVITSNGVVGPLYIKTYWSGSLGGILTVSQELPIANAWLTNTTAMSSGGTASAPAVFDPATAPEVCMNDGFQYDSQYPTPALTGTEVGVVSFKFVKNAVGVSSATGLTNMTPLLAQALWSAPHGLPLSMWTGKTTDTNTVVYGVGRDADSGTRKTAVLETAVQTFVSPPPTFVDVVQWEPTNASGVVGKSNAGTITGQTLWPASSIDGLNFPLADGGYNSGGDLAVALSQTAPYIYVSYLGLSDDATLTNAVGAAADLAYNGTYYSHTNTESGQYSYWTYEFLSYLPTYINTVANAKTVADTLAGQIANEDLSGVGESLTSMRVSRTQEGGAILPK